VSTEPPFSFFTTTRPTAATASLFKYSNQSNFNHSCLLKNVSWTKNSHFFVHWTILEKKTYLTYSNPSVIEIRHKKILRFKPGLNAKKSLIRI
jgi:hypothetical protein